MTREQALAENVSYLRMTVMVLHDMRLHAEAKAKKPDYKGIQHGCDCPLCSMRAPMFDAYLYRGVYAANGGEERGETTEGGEEESVSSPLVSGPDIRRA